MAPKGPAPGKLQGPGRRQLKSRLLMLSTMLMMVLMWSRYRQSLSLGASSDSSLAVLDSGSSSTRSSTGSSSGSSVNSSEPSALLGPLDAANTLQFDVCNGFTNQRIALMSGLVLAAETNRSVVLPDWLLRGYMPDAVKYVTADDGGAVPFGEWFDVDAFATALAAHGVRVVAGKAAEPWNVLINAYDSQSKVNAIVAFLRKKRVRQHIKINCPAFRLPGALMARHEAMLRAAAEALRPAPRFAALIEARRRAVAAASGTEGYNLLHLRVEKDWLALCEWWQNPTEGRDNCMNNTATVGRQLRRLGFPREVPLVVVTSFPDAIPEALSATLKNIRDHKYQAVLGSELAGGAELSREESALVDYYLGLQADKFIGNSVSTFTAFIILERQWLGRPAYHYNGGHIPLELFFPFYAKDNATAAVPEAAGSSQT